MIYIALIADLGLTLEKLEGNFGFTGFVDGDIVPLLRSYGAVSGLSKRTRGSGRKSNVIVVEIGNKK